MNPPINPAEILKIIEKYKDSRGSIIAILEDIQAEYNYLPKSALVLAAKHTGHALVDIYGVATFYTCFSLEPRGKHLCSVCMGTACHVRGAPRVLDEFTKKLAIEPGQTTEDGEFSLTTVNCLGACALGPVAVIDGEYHRNVKSKTVAAVIDRHAAGGLEQAISDDDRIFRVDVGCPHCNRSLMTHDHHIDGQPMIHVTASWGRKHGWMRLSSLYGDYRMESEHDVPADTIIHFFCPRCHGELRSPRLCPRCDAAMIPLLVRAGGIMQFCSRHGCKEHRLDLSS